jgi:hypothetical protein
MKWLIFFLILALSVAALADRFEYISEVDREIPDSDSTGIRDTIFIDQHIQIEDINFYMGIGSETTGWADEISIYIKSPWNYTVGLNSYGGVHFHWYDFWYDTDREEDGPGRLEDYNGYDAYGPWELYCYDIFEDYTLHWYNWHIEIIGIPMSGAAEDNSPIPQEYAFRRAYPNPFNSEITFNYSLPEAAEVTFRIYDIQGRLVRTIPCGTLATGYHNVIWDSANEEGSKVASGTYFVRMSAGEHKFQKSIVLLK